MLFPGPELRPAVLADRRRGSARPDLRRDPLIGVADRLELPQHPAHGRLRRARRHLRSRPSARRHSTRPRGAAGQMGFTFDRLGVRTPGDRDLAMDPGEDRRQRHLSPHIGDPHAARAMEPWPALHRPRRRRSPTSARCLTLDVPREPEDWPDVIARPVPAFDQSLIPLDAPLSPLARALIMGFLESVKWLGQTVPKIEDPAKLRGAKRLSSCTKPSATCSRVSSGPNHSKDLRDIYNPTDYRPRIWITTIMTKSPANNVISIYM